MYIDTGWMITGIKFLQLVSPDSITILKFATILPDTSRPPNMCYCGKTFHNVLEVAAHDTEAHKKGYKCAYKICDEEEERLPHKMKKHGECILRLYVWNVRQLFLKLTNLR